MLMYDLFCGYGGASRPFVDAGWDVVGFDNEPKVKGRYPGQLVLQDVATLDGRQLRGAHLVWASPPCTFFSLANPRPDTKRDPALGMRLVREAWRVIQEAGPRFWMVENVRGSYRAISALLGVPLTKGGYNNNAYWLWGNVDLLMPHCRKSLRSSDFRERARVPYAIGDAVRRAIEVA